VIKLYEVRPGRPPCRVFESAPSVAFLFSGLGFANAGYLVLKEDDEGDIEELDTALAAVIAAFAVYNFVLGVQGLDYETCEVPDGEPISEAGRARPVGYRGAAGETARDPRGGTVRRRPDGAMELRMRTRTGELLARVPTAGATPTVHLEIRLDSRQRDGGPCALKFDEPVLAGAAKRADAELSGAAAAEIGLGRLLAVAQTTTLAGNACRRWGLGRTEQRVLIRFLLAARKAHQRGAGVPGERPAAPPAQPEPELESIGSEPESAVSDSPDAVAVDPESDVDAVESGAAPSPPASSERVHPTREEVVRAMTSIGGAVGRCSAEVTRLFVTTTFGSDGRVSTISVDAADGHDSATPAAIYCIRKVVHGTRLQPFTQPQFIVRYPFPVGPR